MEPINFPESNTRLLGPKGEHDTQVLPLPAYHDGHKWISCWQLSDEEIDEIVRTRCAWAAVWSGRTAPHPISIAAFNPIPKSKEFAFTFQYYSELGRCGIHVWNGVDVDVPMAVVVDKITYRLTNKPPVYEPGRVLDFGDLFFAYVNINDSGTEKVLSVVEKLADNRIKHWPIDPIYYAGTPISEEQKEREKKQILDAVNQKTAKNPQHEAEKADILKRTNEQNSKNKEDNSND